MNTELNCSIVQDLLPLYVEKLTSEESNIAIQHHLKQCEECRKHLENIQTPVEFPTAPEKEIDYMKKVNHSLKRKNLILVSVAIAICITLFGAFLRFYLIGSPISLEDALASFEWSYNAETKTYSIHGEIGQAETGARIKIYEDKQHNQIKIKIYELLPSIFFSDDKFSAQIAWAGNENIVWQGKNEQQVIMNPQYLSLFVTEFKDGQYRNIVDAFDIDGVATIKKLYDKATDVSNGYLNRPFEVEQHDNYIIILLPETSGVYTTWVDDANDSQDETLDKRIFLYQENGTYFFYLQGQHLKEVTYEDVNTIFDYISQHKTK